jgi:fucose 4-O-acetylase-like acetyltransferase
LLGWVDLQNSPNKLVKNRNFILIIPFLFFAGVAVIALFASREHFAYLKRREPTLTLSSTGLTVFQNKMGELFFPWKEIDEVKFRQLGRTEILQVKVKENVRTINLPIQTLMIDRQVLQEELQKYI